MTTHQGACHCGAIRFEFDAEIDRAEVCNCSICSKTAYIHYYVSPDAFRLLTDKGGIADYRFGTGVAHNLFCRACGISPFRRARSDPNKFDINLRCVDGADLQGVEIRRFDGQHWEDAMRKR